MAMLFAAVPSDMVGTLPPIRPLSLATSTPRALRAAKSRLQFHVIASAAKQSILSLRGEMDCFAALAMTARAMDCFAEPVIGRAFARPVGSQ